MASYWELEDAQVLPDFRFCIGWLTMAAFAFLLIEWVVNMPPRTANQFWGETNTILVVSLPFHITCSVSSLDKQIHKTGQVSVLFTKLKSIK